MSLSSSSQELAAQSDGEHTLVSGLIIARQHPATAKGTVFLLLEDEFGYINVIVPAKLYRKNMETVKHSPFLMVEGRFESEGAVKNVVGFRFRQLRVGELAHRSRDFR